MRLLYWKMVTGALQYRRKNKKLQYLERKTYYTNLQLTSDLFTGFIYKVKFELKIKARIINVH